VKGRKQYRYHPKWRAVRDCAKFGELVAFAHRLPRLRRRVQRDLARPHLDKHKVLAAVVSLIEKTHARVGNDRYARDNGSFGITTLRDSHASKRGSKLELEFRAKSGKFARLAIDDARLARVVQHCRDIPGQRLFQYLDERGERRAVTSTDVNRYIHEVTGERFTAKTFRTWGGTLAAALLFDQVEPCSSATDAKRKINRVLAGVAERLGNTPAVCRKSYVHPQLLLSFEQGSLRAALGRAKRARRKRGLSREEAVMISMLESIAKSRPPQRSAA
jgi:DNA topoisomerase I